MNTMILLLLTLLAIKHFVADFLIQTPTMIAEKGRYGAIGGLEHAGIHGIGTAIVMYPFLYSDALIISFIFGLIDATIHYHVDWAKMNMSKGLTTADHKFWIWFGADQLLHSLTYIGLVAILVL